MGAFELFEDYDLIKIIGNANKTAIKANVI